MQIKNLFSNAKIANKKLFIPYITAGDPSLDKTQELVMSLANIGADIVELGVPFSDPVADGATNQRAAQRALKNNVNLMDCCNLIKKLREQDCNVPIVLFTYFNPILRLDLETFSKLASQSGIDAVLVVDLPVDESDEFAAILRQNNVDMVCLAAPTTSSSRIEKINHLNPAFLYYVSRTGVTGAQSDLSLTLTEEISSLRAVTSLPIAVGFGITTPEQAREVAQYADGVIVGSALVQHFENENYQEASSNMLALASELSLFIKR